MSESLLSSLCRRPLNHLPHHCNHALSTGQVSNKENNDKIVASMFSCLIRPHGFNVPCVPLVPVLGILINVYLMLRLDPLTLVRFSLWMLIGK